MKIKINEFANRLKPILGIKPSITFTLRTWWPNRIEKWLSP